MKKFLLLAAFFAALTMSAQEFTLTEVTSTPNVPTDRLNNRQGFGFDGGFVVMDKVLGQISYYNAADGAVEGTVETGATNAWPAITYDEYGNIVARVDNSWAGNFMADTVIMKIYPVDGEPIDVVGNIFADFESENGRCDFFSFIEGNVMDEDEGGILWLVTANSTGILKVPFLGGEIDADHIALFPLEGAALSPTSSTVVNPYIAADGTRHYMLWTRNAQPIDMVMNDTEDGFVATTFTLPNKGATNGCFPLTFGGKDLVIYTTMPNYGNAWAIAEKNAEEAIATVPEVAGFVTNGFQCNWLNAEIVSDTKAIIYQYFPGNFFKTYELTLPGGEEHTYAVCGTPAALFGMENDWDPIAAPEMTLENGIYTWTSEETELAAGDIEFKVVQDHAWDVCFPENNYVVAVEAAGTYTLNVTYNPENNEVNATLTPAEVEHTYAVCGTPAALFGMENDWDPAAAPEMTLNEETGLYEWTSEPTELTASRGNIEFKVVQDHAWDVCFPENNYVIPVEAAGSYTLNVTYNPENNEVNATLTPAEVEHTYAVCGTPAALYGMENDWDPAAAPEMTLNEETGLYEWTSEETELAAGNVEFKVVEDHAWTVCYPENNYVIPVEAAGNYTLSVTYNPETNEVNATLEGEAFPEPAKVYIIGEVNGNAWATNVGVEMTTEDEVIYTADVVLQNPTKVDNVDGMKYCYFSFATKLMEEAADWDGLAPYRFGAVSEATDENPNGDFRFYKNMMNMPLALTFDNGKAFQVEEGTYTLTVDMENMTLTINGESFTGIENISVSNNVKSGRYNLLGQPVNENYKGIVIENGVKKIQK